MTEPLAVSAAVAALRARNPTHADIFQRSYDALKRSGTHVPPLIDYLRLIKDEPVEWLRTLPDSWKCLSYFLKARAAVNALISIQLVSDAMEREDPRVLPALRGTIRTRLKSKHMDAVARGRSGLPEAEPDEAVDQDCDQDGGESSVDEQSEAASDARSDVRSPMKAACFDYCRASDKFAVLAVLTAFWNDGCDDDLAVDVGRLVFMDSPAISILEAFLRARRSA